MVMVKGSPVRNQDDNDKKAPPASRHELRQSSRDCHQYHGRLFSCPRPSSSVRRGSSRDFLGSRKVIGRARTSLKRTSKGLFSQLDFSVCWLGRDARREAIDSVRLASEVMRVSCSRLMAVPMNGKSPPPETSCSRSWPSRQGRASHARADRRVVDVRDGEDRPCARVAAPAGQFLPIPHPGGNQGATLLRRGRGIKAGRSIASARVFDAYLHQLAEKWIRP